jgi:hypothetical protein
VATVAKLERIWPGKIERILTLLEAADCAEALNLPGMGIHPLKARLKGFSKTAMFMTSN